MVEENFSTQRLDHLGIIAGICQQIGLVEQIDAYVDVTGRKVRVGEGRQWFSTLLVSLSRCLRALMCCW